MSVDTFHGNDFEKWVSHFRIDINLKSTLEEMGVRVVDDLTDVYTYADILQDVQLKVSPLEFKRFLRACGATSALAGVTIPTEISAMVPTASPSPPHIVTQNKSWWNIGGKTEDEEHDTTQCQMRDLQKRLDNLKIAAAEPEIPLTETRIKELQEEIRRAEMESYSKRTKTSMAVADKTHREIELAERLAETKRRRGLIDDLRPILRAAASLDIALMLDCTGSMGGYINVARDNMQQFVDGLSKIYPDIPLRIAFVGYRDHCDGAERLAVLRFTTDLNAFKTLLAAQRATGGGDTPEDIFGALNVVNSMEWRSTTRILYHIADAPCHGKPEFHDCDDSYPSGDPHGLKADVLLNALKRHSVQYYFGKITDKTDKMIARFNEIMKGPFVTTTPINAANMISTLTGSVSSAMTPSLSTSARTDGGAVKMKDVLLETTVPVFEMIKAERGHRYQLRKPVSTKALLGSLTDCCIEAFPDAVLATIKMASHPFAKGAMKAAYYGFDCATGKAVILKESMALSESQRTLAKYESFLSCHHAATYMAREFNTAKPAHCEDVQFVEASIVQLRTRPLQPYFIQEEQLVGAFEKFSNNSGYCQPSPTPHGTRHEAVQAFSHWTHHVTGGALMVVDCQGVYSAATRTFTLTDPAIHGTTLTRFGGTNLGRNGFELFYATHACNEHCIALKLPRVARK